MVEVTNNKQIACRILEGSKLFINPDLKENICSKFAWGSRVGAIPIY